MTSDSPEVPEHLRPVTEEIEEQTWRCGTHGELTTEGIGVSVGGLLVCEYCSGTAETQPNDDIDTTIEMVYP